MNEVLKQKSHLLIICRKTSHSWTRDTPALTDDGHAWRKYGQKVIHNANHPRYTLIGKSNINSNIRHKLKCQYFFSRNEVDQDHVK